MEAGRWWLELSQSQAEYPIGNADQLDCFPARERSPFHQVEAW